MKTKTITVYNYDELEENAKENAISWFRKGMFYDELWYESVYENAENIGLKISSFNCGHHEILGDLILRTHESVQKIIHTHGKETDTYKLAQNYYRRKHTREPYSEEEYEYELLQEYLSILQKEEDYLSSYEYAEEMIRSNEYTFYKNGKIAE